jgi:hypothetical protein
MRTCCVCERPAEEREYRLVMSKGRVFVRHQDGSRVTPLVLKLPILHIHEIEFDDNEDDGGGNLICETCFLSNESSYKPMLMTRQRQQQQQPQVSEQVQPHTSQKTPTKVIGSKVESDDPISSQSQTELHSQPPSQTQAQHQPLQTLQQLPSQFFSPPLSGRKKGTTRAVREERLRQQQEEELRRLYLQQKQLTKEKEREKEVLLALEQERLARKKAPPAVAFTIFDNEEPRLSSNNNDDNDKNNSNSNNSNSNSNSNGSHVPFSAKKPVLPPSTEERKRRGEILLPPHLLSPPPVSASSKRRKVTTTMNSNLKTNKLSTYVSEERLEELIQAGGKEEVMKASVFAPVMNTPREGGWVLVFDEDNEKDDDNDNDKSDNNDGKGKPLLVYPQRKHDDDNRSPISEMYSSY